MFNDMFNHMVATLPHFLAYFGTAIVLAVLFLAIYTKITPHDEFALIKVGNSSAAIQLIGAFLGFAIPMAIVIGNSVSIADVVVWGVVVLFVQTLTFFAIERLTPTGIVYRVDEQAAAHGIFVGGLSLGVGILQAACMVP